jgi:hypothetical protein
MPINWAPSGALFVLCCNSAFDVFADSERARPAARTTATRTAACRSQGNVAVKSGWEEM